MLNTIKNIRNLIFYIIGTCIAKIDRHYKILYGYIDTLHKFPKLRDSKRLNRVDDHAFAELIKMTDCSWLVDKLIQIDSFTDSIERVLFLFPDKINRIIYKSELAYKILGNIQLLSPFSFYEYNDALKKLPGFIENNSYVELLFDDEALLATTFIIEQYKYDPYITVEAGDIFLDCGAYHGETAIWAVNLGAQKVYCFEPNKENYSNLQRTAERIGNGKIIPFQYGIGDEDGILTMEEKGPASYISSTGNEKIQIFSLDSFCIQNNIKPNFIKMDIEGFELEALHGASKIIKKYRPKLAICLYHKLSHMWDIPLYIDSLGLNYSFFCKKNHPICEFVLYCAAKK
jgi:FkbM family methyltransferase